MTALSYDISLVLTTLEKTEFCNSARACVRGGVGCILRGGGCSKNLHCIYFPCTFVVNPFRYWTC